MPRRRLASLAAVEVFGFGAAQVIRLGSNLVLARLLFPAAFGLMAMLSLVLYGIYMLTDVGLAQAVIAARAARTPSTWTPPGRSRPRAVSRSGSSVRCWRGPSRFSSGSRSSSR